MRRPKWLAVVLVCLAIRPATAQQPVPVGEEIDVTVLGGAADVGQTADGDFVVVWLNFDGDGYGILARRYDRMGVSVGDEFVVNSYTTGAQAAASLAVRPDGDFIVTWGSRGSYGSDCCDAAASTSVQAQRYDATGSPVGSEFQVNSYTTGGQDGPDVAIDGDGNFVIVWTDYGPDGSPASDWRVHGQRFDAAGAMQGDEFMIASYTTGGQTRPRIAANPDGSFVVIWTGGDSPGDDTDTSVQGRSFGADGTPIGAQFQINSYTTGTQFLPSVGSDEMGNFVVVWTSAGSFGSDPGPDFSVQAQRFDPMGSALGTQFQVNTYTTEFQQIPEIVVESEGSFLVTWESVGSFGSDTDASSIQAQRFDAGGSPAGVEFQINTTTANSQLNPAVSATGDGRFVVAWQSFAFPSFPLGISAQRLQVPMPIFEDGFESGDVSAWSSAVP